MYVSALFLSLFVVCCFAGEPHCSKFSDDVALLEKVIRTEVKFEQFQAEFTELRKDVKSTMKQMANDFKKVMDTVDGMLKEIQRERKDIHNEIATMSQTTRAEVEAFMENSNDVFAQKEKQIERMSTDLRDLYTDSLATPVIGFKATDLRNKSPADDQVLVFPTVLFNAGEGYNSVNGIFTARVPGIYLLTVHLCVGLENFLTAQIMVDESDFGRCYATGYAYYVCNTADAIVYMNVGAKAYIKVSSIDGSLYTLLARQVSFSGSLLNKGE